MRAVGALRSPSNQVGTSFVSASIAAHSHHQQHPGHIFRRKIPLLGSDGSPTFVDLYAPTRKIAEDAELVMTPLPKRTGIAQTAFLGLFLVASELVSRFWNVVNI